MIAVGCQNLSLLGRLNFGYRNFNIMFWGLFANSNLYFFKKLYLTTFKISASHQFFSACLQLILVGQKHFFMKHPPHSFLDQEVLFTIYNHLKTHPLEFANKPLIQWDWARILSYSWDRVLYIVQCPFFMLADITYLCYRCFLPIKYVLQNSLGMFVVHVSFSFCWRRWNMSLLYKDYISNV